MAVVIQNYMYYHGYGNTHNSWYCSSYDDTLCITIAVVIHIILYYHSHGNTYNFWYCPSYDEQEFYATWLWSYSTLQHTAYILRMCAYTLRRSGVARVCTSLMCVCVCMCVYIYVWIYVYIACVCVCMCVCIYITNHANTAHYTQHIGAYKLHVYRRIYTQYWEYAPLSIYAPIEYICA